MLYTSTPSGTGAFDVTRSGSAGYANFSQGLPWYSGRSQLATVPEYLRMPGQLEKDVLMTIEEKGSNLAKILLEWAEKNGTMEKDDVRYWWRTELIPHPRFYLKQQAYTVSDMQTTFKLTDYTRPTQSYPTSTGNPKVIGDIARLQAGDFLLLMFAWLKSDRTGSVAYKYKGTEGYATPVPEICKVLSVDYAANSFVVERNWAGSQRAAAGTAPGTVTVVANSATPTSAQVRARDAFFLQMPRSMKEDNIDAKVYGMTGTWDYGIMKRTLKAWGAGYMGEVIRKNLGLGSKLDQDRKQAFRDYYNAIAVDALWGEKYEEWDPETGEWQGYTDGLLATVNEGHYIGMVPLRPQLFRSSAQYAYGTFDIPIFNKFLEDKGYYSKSGHMIAVCGMEPYTAFGTMINQMTQNIPNIVSECKIEGKRYTSVGGLTVDFIHEEAMTLNGLRNKMIMFDPTIFRMVKLRNYPTDIVEVANENPLLSNGFIHGVYSFINTNPDACWVFTVDEMLASATGATFANNCLGVAQA
jgi:hypothetical protein